MPNLATGYDLSADKLTWTFKLRDGVKMQDGSPFTATDVKTAVDRIVDRGLSSRTMPTSSRSSADGHRDRPADGGRSRPTSRTRTWSDRHAAADRHRLLQQGRRRRLQDQPGGGRAMEVRLPGAERQRQVRPVRRLLGSDPQAELAASSCTPSCPTSRAASPASRPAPSTSRSASPPASADGLKSASNVKINENKGTGLGYCMMYDNNFPDQPSPLKDVNVRKALLMAVDRDSIAKTLYKGFAKTPPSNIADDHAGLQPGPQSRPVRPRRRQEAARHGGPVEPGAAAQHLRGHVDGAGHPEADRDDRRVLESDRRERPR